MDQETFERKTSNYPNIVRKVNFAKQNWHLLYNFETRRPLAIAKYQATVNLLAENAINAYAWHVVNNKKNQFGKSMASDKLDFNSPWDWKFNLVSTEFETVPFDLDYNERYRYLLINTKAAVLDKIHKEINMVRRSFSADDIVGQEIIYLKKFQEATDILSSDSVDADKYPFVGSYAQLTGANIRIAAMEVVQQHNFQMKHFVGTELIRIKYSRAVILATEISELLAIEVNFNAETNDSIKR